MLQYASNALCSNCVQKVDTIGHRWKQCCKAPAGHNSMLFSHACPHCVSSLLLASLPLLRPNNGGAAVAGLWWLRWSQSEEVLLSFDHKSHFPTLPASTQSVSNLICLVILNLLLNLINLVQILSFD